MVTQRDRYLLCFTPDPHMVTLPQVDEDQEKYVWCVLEIKWKELMQDDETERKRSVRVVEPTTIPHFTDKSDNSQTTNLIGYKKTSKMVSPPDLVPDHNTVDVAKVAKEVIPRNTIFLRPLLYTY